MLRALTLIALLAGPAAATEPPCHIPMCMGQISAIGKERVALVSADGKLEVRLVGTEYGHMVLIEVVRDKVAAPVLAAFPIKKGAGFELVPFAGDLKKPLLTFAGPWMTSPSKLGTVDVTPTKTTVDGRALFARYKKQQQSDQAKYHQTHAAEKLVENLAELNKACGTSITATQDWSKLPDSWFETSMRDAAHVCEDNFFGIALNRCDSAAGKQAVAAKLKSVRCVYKASGALVMTLTNGALVIELSVSASREKQGSQAQRFLERRL